MLLCGDILSRTIFYQDHRAQQAWLFTVAHAQPLFSNKKLEGETERDPDFVREGKCVQEEDAVWNTLVFQPVALNVTIIQILPKMTSI